MATRHTVPYRDPPRLSVDQAKRNITTPTNTLRGIKTGQRNISGASLAGSTTGLSRSMVTGGPPAGGPLRRTRRFEEGVTPSSADTLESSIINQKPGAPVLDAINNTPFDTPNDRGIIQRKPTKTSANINVFHTNMAMFKRRERENAAKIWHNNTRSVPYSKSSYYQRTGKIPLGQDTVMTLPALNELLFRMQTKHPLDTTAHGKKKKKDDIGVSPEVYYAQRSMKPMQVIKDWGFDGFVAAQMKGASYRGAKDDIDEHHGMTLTIITDGEANKVFNIWGDHIKRDLQELWFIVKGIDRSKQTKSFSFKGGPKWASATYRSDPDASDKTTPLPTPEMAMKGLIFCDKPVQVIPWTSHIKKRPTMADLEYKDDFGNTMHGEEIYVGFNRGVGPSDEMMAQPGAYYDALDMVRCPEVTLNINRYGRLKYV